MGRGQHPRQGAAEPTVGGRTGASGRGDASLAEAQRALADSPYGKNVVVGQSLAETEHAVAAMPLWHMRVLAGWQPRAGSPSDPLARRRLRGGQHRRPCPAVGGRRREPSFTLGALATAWPRLGETSSLASCGVRCRSRCGATGIGIAVGHRVGGPDRLGGAGGRRSPRGLGLGMRRLALTGGAPAAGGTT